MKNITVSIDEHTHRQARIRAAELGTSVSALVRTYLNRLVTEPLEEKGARRGVGDSPRASAPGVLKELFEDWDAQRR